MSGMNTCNQYTTHHACDCILEQLRRADDLAVAAEKVLQQTTPWKALGKYFERLREALAAYDELATKDI